jgi:hypothetical protein
LPPSARNTASRVSMSPLRLTLRLLTRSPNENRQHPQACDPMRRHNQTRSRLRRRADLMPRCVHRSPPRGRGGRGELPGFRQAGCLATQRCLWNCKRTYEQGRDGHSIPARYEPANTHAMTMAAYIYHIDKNQ